MHHLCQVLLCAWCSGYALIINQSPPTYILQSHCFQRSFWMTKPGFPLQTNMLQPYPGQYLSGKRSIENICFCYNIWSYVLFPHEDNKGIPTTGWTELGEWLKTNLALWLLGGTCCEGPLLLNQKTFSCMYVQAAVDLYNYLRATESNVYYHPGFIDGENESGNQVDWSWRQDQQRNFGLQNICQAGSNWHVLSFCTVYPWLSLLNLSIFLQALPTSCRDMGPIYISCSPSGELSWKYDYTHWTS